MSRRLTKGEILMRVSGELGALSQIIPGNPMDIQALARNAKDAEEKLRHLSSVLSAMVPSMTYGGLDDARTEWLDYQANYHPKNKQ